MKLCLSVSVALMLVAVTVTMGFAQTTTIVPGDPRFDAFGGGPDLVDLGSLDVHLSIPLVQKKGRGIDFNYSLVFDSLYIPTPDNYNWRFVASGAGGGYMTFSQVSEYNCEDNQAPAGIEWGAYVYFDASGKPHPFSNQTYTTYDCGVQTSVGFPAMALDGSGITLICPTCVSGGSYQPTVQLPSGIIVSNQEWANASDPAGYDSNGTPNPYYQDSNGNYIGWSGLFNEIPTTGTQNYTDTLGDPVLSTNVTLPNNTYQQWQGTGTVVKSYYGGQYTIVFNSQQATSISMPDGRSYSFTYGTQVLPGTNSSNLTSITLPTGGTISYSANGDGSSGFTRTLTDGEGHSSKWIYTKTSNGTTVTDPLGNQTAYVIAEQTTAFPQNPDELSIQLHSLRCLDVKDSLFWARQLGQNPFFNDTNLVVPGCRPVHR